MTNISIADKQPATSGYNEQAALQQHVITDSECIQVKCERVQGGTILVSLDSDGKFTAYTVKSNDALKEHGLSGLLMVSPRVRDMRLSTGTFDDGYRTQIVIWDDEQVVVLSRRNQMILCVKCGTWFHAIMPKQIRCYKCDEEVR